MPGTPTSTPLPRSNRRSTRSPISIGITLAAMLMLSLLVVPVALADGGREILIQDRCDPASFNAAAGADICSGTGDVTFAKFFEKLNPQDGGHGAWRFSRDKLGIKRGEAVHVTNTGGETHSFTEVSAFGAGIVDLLNAALPAGTAPAVPVGDPNQTFVPSGGSITLNNLSLGQHKFQCLIHPWMRTVIEVQKS